MLHHVAQCCIRVVGDRTVALNIVENTALHDWPNGADVLTALDVKIVVPAECTTED